MALTSVDLFPIRPAISSLRSAVVGSPKALARSILKEAKALLESASRKMIRKLE
jgi:hypothetical protein